MQKTTIIPLYKTKYVIYLTENNFVFLFIDVCGEFNIFLHFFELLSYSCTLLLNLIFLSGIAENISICCSNR